MFDTNWNEANGMVVPSQAAIGVFESGSGQILIVQQSDTTERDDVIAINKCNLQALIEALASYVEKA